MFFSKYKCFLKAIPLKDDLTQDIHLNLKIYPVVVWSCCCDSKDTANTLSSRKWRFISDSNDEAVSGGKQENIEEEGERGQNKKESERWGTTEERERWRKGEMHRKEMTLGLPG